ncbi:MAG TPA: S-methyl-5'-thioadenosine phosphorylase [Pseudomonadales bacterium]|jgi:5'-methylthioadenosine phosphorylase|nr:S-methyl-5'-thioadenosine phosphorylase [Gammaproteobacteria bacterium]MDP6025314.1 S-methyl-5'-thioadenosine phosphorylase [Pseudomonadales bacterium]MDP6315092.1 S-methyl-5'-thioadenosine phosphorylase [Pseudomonadales bacterium]MDP7315896.1 S-methyl-5'-thioadenosine phosphorylase [Pseudomonadales bacterium]HJP52291.1 S-methyl-5'-thioadenosine phosphorylase [Pseudomonadales bacterium]|tara:strand:+ start:326 stop:1078 length:753 start_codon:yes stop_codon:yes gene_type:complete
MPRVGIIGGSGLDDPQILIDAEEMNVETPYGDPSSALTCGEINGMEVRLLARHGKDHHLSPTEVNNRANVHALYQQGVSHIIATTACGSLREEIGRGHLVIVDQFIDFTRHRKITFKESFTEEIGHTAMADPFDGPLRQLLIEEAEGLGYVTHHGGTVITIEGPRFSTRAESNMFRIWGADVINMSIAPEAMLSNEMGIPYAVVAMSTDYDCWKEDEAPVSWDEILKVFEENADNVKSLLLNVIPKVTTL